MIKNQTSEKPGYIGRGATGIALALVLFNHSSPYLSRTSALSAASGSMYAYSEFLSSKIMAPETHKEMQMPSKDVSLRYRRSSMLDKLSTVIVPAIHL